MASSLRLTTYQLSLRNDQRLSTPLLCRPSPTDTSQGLLFEKSTFGREVHIVYQKPVASL